MQELQLKYGCNPHQTPSIVRTDARALPIAVLNGTAGYINLLDAVTAWQLVRDMKAATGKPSAASFKHVNPAGAAVEGPLDEAHQLGLRVSTDDLSPIARAYIRARGGDPLASFGDAVAVSERVDASLANILKTEVSDLIVAPGFDNDAIEILRGKQGGSYLILEIDENYSPSPIERKTLFGLDFVQPIDESVIDRTLFERHGSSGGGLPSEVAETLIVATLAAKYAVSNSVCVAIDGQVIGLGAGQQSRIDCVRLACAKAEKWLSARHPDTLNLPFVEGLSKPERTNLVDLYLRHAELSDRELSSFESKLAKSVPFLERAERRRWFEKFSEICLSSDGFFPFRDNVDRAASTNIQYIAHPGGSKRDSEVEDAAAEYGIRLISTGLRCFRH